MKLINAFFIRTRILSVQVKFWGICPALIEVNDKAPNDISDAGWELNWGN